jgi:hypothetical protein
MKRALVLVAFAGTMMLLASSTQSAPQLDAGTRAAAERLVAVMGGEAKYEESFEEMMRTMDRMLDAQPGTEEVRKATRERMNSMMKAMMQELRGKVDTIFVDAYSQTFSADELNAIAEFYASPIGQKFIARQPQVTSSAMLKMTELMYAIMPELWKKAR